VLVLVLVLVRTLVLLLVPLMLLTAPSSIHGFLFESEDVACEVLLGGVSFSTGWEKLLISGRGCN